MTSAGSGFATSPPTGLRPGEATGLTWADIDLDNALLHVRGSLKLEDGKLVIDERLKTARSRRTLSLPHPVLDALAEQGRLQAELAEHGGYANRPTGGTRTTPTTPENPKVFSPVVAFLLHRTLHHMATTWTEPDQPGATATTSRPHSKLHATNATAP